ncbi:hypothetical protein DKG79_01250 [Escherichia fergusonii]|nr:hypothetical protein DKG79_01250 [Escherichia fergusonii]
MPFALRAEEDRLPVAAGFQNGLQGECFMNKNTFRHHSLTRAVAFLCIAAQVLFPVAATASGHLRTGTGDAAPGRR